MWETSLYESYLVPHDVSIFYMLDIIDPYGRHYRLPFRSWHYILDIILLELVLFVHSLLPFLLSYFFIAGRLYINYVAQQCHITRVCLRPLDFIGSISYYSSSWIILHLLLSLYYFESLSFTMESLGSSSCMLIGVNLELSSLVL